jgi:hypothetical protein
VSEKNGPDTMGYNVCYCYFSESFSFFLFFSCPRLQAALRYEDSGMDFRVLEYCLLIYYIGVHALGPLVHPAPSLLPSASILQGRASLFARLID